MRIPIPEHVKSAVIDAWLRGKTRDKIASEYNISTGSVSNIIEQWQNMIGVYDANNLRELGLGLKKAKITPIQCADGLRITKIINKLGIDEAHLFDFLEKLYNKSKEQKSEPANIVRVVKVINAYPEINSLNDIPQHINKRRQEQIKLDAEIYYKKHEIEKLDQGMDRKKKEIQDLKDDFDSIRKEMQDEKKDFLLFKDAKDELKKNGLDIQILEPLTHVIKILQEMNFRPLTILSEFSDINQYRELVANKERKIKELESHTQELKTINDNYETKIKSNETMVLSIKQLENLGFNASDIKNLEITFLEISKKYGLTKKEIKILFLRYMDRLYSLLPLEQDILEKTDKLSILDSEISSRQKVIEESQPIVFSILQNLVKSGLNENNILLAFKIFKTDLCNNMPFDMITYLERLSKDLDKYPTVRDTLAGLNNKILLKKSYIGKLGLVRSNLEAFLFSLLLTIYFYSILLNVQQVQIQKNLIKRIPLVCVLNYYLSSLFFIGINRPKKTVKSRFKKQDNHSSNNNKKSREVKKINKNNNDKLVD
jgi:hypothetical protein